MEAATAPRPLEGGIGLAGKVAVAWATALGVLLGGFLVAGMTLAGKLSGGGLLLSSTGLFGVGAIAGFVHGGVLGYFGRAPGTPRRRSAAGIALATLYALPALAVGWAISGWIAMTVVALYTHEIAAIVGATIAWLLGLGVLALAGKVTVRAARNAYARWEERRAGTVLVAATFGALLVIFLAEHPTIWGTPFRVTEVGAVLLALEVSIWIAGPIITLGLALLRRLPIRLAGVEVAVTRPGTLARLAIALGVGVALGLLALPFHTAPLDVPLTVAGGDPIAEALRVLGAALVDEVLLRLFLVTTLAWVILRWRGRTEGTTALAVAGAAVVQLLLYLPGVLAIGFPNPLAALGYVTVAVLLPALVFGTIYLRLGFGSAVLAHAGALGALVLLAA